MLPAYESDFKKYEIGGNKQGASQTLKGFSALTVYPSDSNFILFRVNRESDQVFKRLMENGILVRDLGNHPRLDNCLRVTVGTRQENDRFIGQMNAII